MLQRSSPAFTVYVDEVFEFCSAFDTSFVELVCVFLFTLAKEINKIPAIKTTIAPKMRFVYDSVNLKRLTIPFCISFCIFAFTVFLLDFLFIFGIEAFLFEAVLVAGLYNYYFKKAIAEIF